MADRRYDVIIAADCLFCAHMHLDLLHTMKELMHEKSVCYIIAPKRKGTLEDFRKAIEEVGGFKHEMKTKITEEVDNMVEAVHKSPFFKEDEHVPYLLTITKI